MRTKVRVGRLTLNESETRTLAETPGDGSGRTFDLTGVETAAGHTKTDIRRIHADLVNSAGLLVPVVFDNKTEWNAFYRVQTGESVLTDWDSEGARIAEWKLTLARVGSSNDIDLESRISGSAPLLNDFANAGERWLTPPGGHQALWSGPASPSQVTRTGADGPLIVYRGIANNINPRYNCRPSNYGRGRCRFVDSNGHERTGLSFDTAAEGWQIENSLVRLSRTAGSPATFVLSSHDGVQWEPKGWILSRAGTALGAPVSVSLIRNEYECVIVRVLWDVSPNGRVFADLTLRRGSRFVEIYLQSQLSATLRVATQVPEAGTLTSGRIVATANDAAANRYVVGSARTFTDDAPSGAISKATALAIDAFIGVEVGGTAAAVGDRAVDLYAQYIGAPAERVTGVRQ